MALKTKRYRLKPEAAPEHHSLCGWINEAKSHGTDSLHQDLHSSYSECCISDSILDCPINPNFRPLFHYKRSQIPTAAAGSISYISMIISLYLFNLCSYFFQNVAYLYKKRAVSLQSNYPVVSLSSTVCPHPRLFRSRSTPLCSLWPTKRPHLPTDPASTF